MTDLAKMISRFDQASRVTAAEAERHYTSVHFPFAQQLLAAMPQIRSYHINRVVRQLDLAGGWAQRPSAWRFVVLRFDPGRSLEFDALTTERITRDHINFLRHLRSTVVTENMLFDRLHRHTALQKYLIEVDRPAGATSITCDNLLTDLGATLTEEAATRFGARQVCCSRVLAELAAEAVEEEGQRATDQPIADTDKVGYIEIYFDDERWGADLFKSPKVLTALRDPSLLCKTYVIEERCGVDRRAPTGH